MLTYRDAIDHLVDWCDGLTSEADQNRARSAIQQAYRNTYFDCEWTYFKSHDRITLDAPYITGTVGYQVSSGAVPRQVTLAGGIWPNWARYGKIIFNVAASFGGTPVYPETNLVAYPIGPTRVPIYRVAERVNDEVLSLEEDFAPALDFPGGTTFQLFHTVYPLPADIWKLEEIHDERNIWASAYVEPTEWLGMERYYGGTSRPFFWTVMGAENLYGSMAIYLYGRPTQYQTLDFIMKRQGRPLRFEGYRRFSTDYQSGLITAPQPAGTSVNFDLSQYGYGNAAAVGAVLRLAPNQNTPSGIGGGNPYLAQRVLKIAPSPGAANWLVDTPWPQTSYQSAPGFVISDPVDLPPYLIDLFLRYCEYEMSLKMQPARVQLAKAELQNARLEARRRDAVFPVHDSPNSWRGWKYPAWQLLTGVITPTAG
jgi:hypothetical protein